MPPAGKKRRAPEAGAVDEYDDELALAQDADKPGFIAWAEALETREATSLSNACLGKWLPAENVVELITLRGKMHTNMGFARGSTRYLHPEEALFLVDEGSLYLMKPPGWKDPAALAAAAGGGEQPEPKRQKADDDAPAVQAAAPAEEEAAAAAPAAAAADDDATASAASSSSAAAAPAPAPAPAPAAEPVNPLVAALAPLGYRPPAGIPAYMTKPHPEVLPLRYAYELLLRYTSLPHYLVYSSLLSSGLIVVRHRKAWAHQANEAAKAAQADAAKALAAESSLSLGGVDDASGAAPFLSAAAAATAAQSGSTPLIPPAGSEARLEAAYDVFARDGITTFKPSAPGPPDFFVVVAPR